MDNNQLYHYGIRGMRWGVRRFQNEDGSLTNAGKRKQARIDKRMPNKNKNTKNNKTNSSKNNISLSSKQSKGRRNVKIALGVTGGLLAADFVSSKVTGQPNLIQSVNNLIKILGA